MDLKIGTLEDGTAIGSGLATAVNRLRRRPQVEGDPAPHRWGEQQGAHRSRAPRRRRPRRSGSRSTPSASAPSARRRFRPGAASAGSATSCCRCGSTSRCSGRSRSKTGGRISAPRDSEALSRIFHQIDQLEKTPIQVTRYTRYDEATRPLIAARARRPGARAPAQRDAGGAGPVIFDAPLLLVPRTGPRGLAPGCARLARTAAPDPAGPALVAARWGDGAGRGRWAPAALAAGGAARRCVGLAGPAGWPEGDHDRRPTP